jgi:hypothetical protein
VIFPCIPPDISSSNQRDGPPTAGPPGLNARHRDQATRKPRMVPYGRSYRLGTASSHTLSPADVQVVVYARVTPVTSAIPSARGGAFLRQE